MTIYNNARHHAEKPDGQETNLKHIKRSQLALSNFPYTKNTLDFCLDSLERIGGPNIEFYAAYPHFYLGDATPADIRNLARKIRAHNLHVIDFCPENCSYPVNAASADPRVRARSIAHYVTGIQTASELECPYCLFFPGYALMDEDPRPVWDRAVAAYRYLSEIAETYGVTLILESAKKTSSVLGSTDLQLKFMEEVGSPYVDCMIDTTNIIGMGETLESCYAKLGLEHVKHVHFKGAAGTPQSFSTCPPDEGFLDLEPLVRWLDEDGYDGYFGCEVFKPYYYEPEAAMLRFKDWFDKLDPVMDY